MTCFVSDCDDDASGRSLLSVVRSAVLAPALRLVVAPLSVVAPLLVVAPLSAVAPLLVVAPLTLVAPLALV